MDTRSFPNNNRKQADAKVVSSSSSFKLTLFAMGDAGALYSTEGQFDPHFLTAPVGLLDRNSSNLIIILFKDRINYYLEKKMVQYLENWPNYFNFCWPRNVLKIFENFIF